MLPLTLLAAACLAPPERTNPFDPAIAPQAQLVVVDRSVIVRDPGATCSLTLQTDPDETASWVGVVGASRGRCLALDARGSTDPQLDVLTFEFRYPDGSEVPQSAPGIALLDTVVLTTLPVDEPLTFEVTARDPGGSTSVATRDVILTNAAPQASAGSSLIRVRPVTNAAGLPAVRGHRS